MLPVSRIIVVAISVVFAHSSNAGGGDDTYSIRTLATLGGTRTQGNSLDDRGWAAGFSTYAGNSDRHAVLWSGSQIRDLGTLGGANSSVVWPVRSVSGLVAGIAQTAQPDPLGENWSCSAFFVSHATGLICRGFAWQGDTMRMLPTLGGNNGFAAGANNRGEITGWAETDQFDPSCEGAGPGKSGQVLQFLPVVYGPGADQIRALPLLAGDSSGAATAINDHGQAVGISGSCDQAVGRRTAAHAVLWDNGAVVDIGAGTLPAPFWNTPMAINEHGDVVGFAGDPADETGGITHAFLWTREGGMQLLDARPGDNSTATAINAQRQVTGYFVAANGALHAFVWDARNGMRDLNDLKQDYPNVIALANDINDAGEITGRATVAGGTRVAIVAVPLDQ